MEGERRMSVVDLPGDFLPEGAEKLKLPDGPPESKISIADNESKNNLMPHLSFVHIPSPQKFQYLAFMSM